MKNSSKLITIISTVTSLAILTSLSEESNVENRLAERGNGHIKHCKGYILKQIDSDGDHKITYEEFKAFFEKRIEERFKKLDRNGDGVISIEDRKGEIKEEI